MTIIIFVWVTHGPMWVIDIYLVANMLNFQQLGYVLAHAEFMRMLILVGKVLCETIQGYDRLNH